MKKVSVIVPVYNAEKYLEKCLNSLVEQTLEEIEIIIINDGSTDSSQKIIEKYAEKYGQKIITRMKKNEGQAIARNLGIELCSGKDIGFVDADDYVCNDMFQRMYDEAERQKADMVICDYYEVHDSNRKTVSVKDALVNKDLLVDPKAAPWNKLYRKDLVIKSGVKFHEKLIYEDTAFYANLVPYIRKCCNLHVPLLYHIIRQGSTTKVESAEKYKQMFPIMDGIVQYYKEHGFFEQFYEELEYFYSKMLLGSSFYRIATLNNRKIRDELLTESVDKVQREFPKFRSNRYYKHRMIKIYMCMMRKWNTHMIGTLIYMRNKAKIHV